MDITFQSDVSFTLGQIVDSSAVPDLVAQGVTGDVKISNLRPGLRRSNPDIAKGRYRYLARPYPANDGKLRDP